MGAALLAACVALLALPGVAQAQLSNLVVAGGGGGGGGSKTGWNLGAIILYAGSGGSSGWGDGSTPGGGGGGGGAYVGASHCNYVTLECDGAKGADASAGGAGGAGGTGGGAGGGGIKGADGSSGGAGGAGGAAVATIASGSYGGVRVYGGDGGDGGDGSGGAGAGGSATLSVSGDLTLSYLIDVVSGASGSNAGAGAGGAASLTVGGTLESPRVNVTKKDGALTVNVGTLDVENKDTTLTLNGTAAGDVTFTTARLGSQTLTVNFASTGRARIDTLTLTGAGQLTDAGDALDIKELHSDGGVLNDANWNGLLTHLYGDPDITLEGGGLTINAGDQTLDHKLVGAGALTKQGTGTLTLTNASNSYSGNTQVADGTLVLAHAGAAGTGGVQVDSGATLRLAASGTYANAMTGSAGSTLDVQAAGISAPSVQGFENISFTLPSTVKAGDTVLTVTGTPTDLNGTTITIGGSIPALAPGEELTLISSVSGTPKSSSIPSGFTLDASSGALVLKALPPSAGNATAVPTLGEVGLLLTSFALAGAATPALRRRKKQGEKADTHL